MRAAGGARRSTRRAEAPWRDSARHPAAAEAACRHPEAPDPPAAGRRPATCRHRSAAARALQPGLRRLRTRELRPGHPGVPRVPAALPEHGLLRQRAVLDRRVPVLEAALRRGGRGLGRADARLPVQRQAAGRDGSRRGWPSSGWAAGATRSPSIGRWSSAIRTPRPAKGPGAPVALIAPSGPRPAAARANMTPTPRKAAPRGRGAAEVARERKATWPA